MTVVAEEVILIAYQHGLLLWLNNSHFLASVTAALSTAEEVSIPVGGGSVTVTRTEKASGPVTGTWDFTFEGKTVYSKYTLKFALKKITLGILNQAFFVYLTKFKDIE